MTVLFDWSKVPLELGLVTLAFMLCSIIGLERQFQHKAAGVRTHSLVGLGSSNIVPVLFTAVGRQTSMPQSVALPAMTTMGYAGVLAGPAGIGFIAHHTSLGAAFVLVAAMMAGVAISGKYLKV